MGGVMIQKLAGLNRFVELHFRGSDANAAAKRAAIMESDRRFLDAYVPAEERKQALEFASAVHKYVTAQVAQGLADKKAPAESVFLELQAWSTDFISRFPGEEETAVSPSAARLRLWAQMQKGPKS